MLLINFVFIFIYFLFLTNCTSIGVDFSNRTFAPKRATSKPYSIRGLIYYPQQYYEYVEEGCASHYGEGDVFHGRLTAIGDFFDKNGISAAHRTLPLPCIVRVTNLKNGKILKVRVNDRGPYLHLEGSKRRIIDLSAKAAKLLGFFREGIAKVRVEVLVYDSLYISQRRLLSRFSALNRAKFIKPKVFKIKVMSIKKNIEKKLKHKEKKILFKNIGSCFDKVPLPDRIPWWR